MFRKLFFVVALMLASACSESKTANDMKPCIKSSADTAGEAAKTGGKTAVEGIKTFGQAVGGLFEGGTDEAKRRWKQGAQETRSTAKEGAANTKEAAGETKSDCK